MKNAMIKERVLFANAKLQNDIAEAKGQDPARVAWTRRRLSSAYVELFRHDSVDVVQTRLQEILDEDKIISPAVQASIEVLAERGMYHTILTVLGENPRYVHPSAFSALGRYQWGCVLLWAYAEMTERRYLACKKYAGAEEWEPLTGGTALFVSLKDFILGIRPGEDYDTVVSQSLHIATIMREVSGSDIALQSVVTFEYILEVLQKSAFRAPPDCPQSLLGGFSIEQLLAASGEMGTYQQLESLLLLLTGGIKFLEGCAFFERDEDSRFFRQNAVAIKANIQAFMSKMTAEDLSKMDPLTFNAVNRTLNYIAEIR